MNETNRQTIGKLFRVIGDSLLAMDDHEFDLMLQGKGFLRFTPVSEKAKKGVVASRVRQDDANVIAQKSRDAKSLGGADVIAQKLRDAESREEAIVVIASINRRPRKAFLSHVAQAAGVLVESKDSIAKIEHKLIEATVGAKLRSRAFKEVPFGPTGS